MATQRLYLIGAGVIAREHANAARQLPDFTGTEIHVCDLSVDSLQSFKEQFPASITYDNLDQMLNPDAEASDIVVVATPPATHAALSIQAMRSGRHVLCEKPMAMSVQEAEQMYSVARECGVHLATCGSRFVGQPNINKARDMIQANTLGNFYHVVWRERKSRFRVGIEYQPSTPWFVTKKANGGGAIMDWAPYDFALLRYLIDPERVTVLNATFATPHAHHNLPDDIQIDVEFHGTATLLFERKEGSSVTISYDRSCCIHGEEESKFTLEGESGSISLNWVACNEISLYTDEAGQPIKNEIEVEPDTIHFHHRPLLYFMQQIKGQTNAGTNNSDAVFVFNIIRAIYQAAETRSAVIVNKPSVPLNG